MEPCFQIWRCELKHARDEVAFDLKEWRSRRGIEAEAGSRPSAPTMEIPFESGRI